MFILSVAVLVTGLLGLFHTRMTISVLAGLAASGTVTSVKLSNSAILMLVIFYVLVIGGVVGTLYFAPIAL